MTQVLHIHSENPQQRLIDDAVQVIKKGGVVAYPTDSGYALGCHVGDKTALERIRRLRQLDKNHNFTLMCRDFSELATYARVDNGTFRLLKAHTPGAYTFILQATHEVPRRLMHPKRKTIGLRIPDNPISLALLETLAEPLMSVTLIMPGAERPLADVDEICSRLEGQVDLIIAGGFCGIEPTTVVELVSGSPVVLRAGRGDTASFEE